MAVAEVGTLLLTYHKGRGPDRQFELVRRNDFVRLLRTIAAYDLVRQLRQMSDEDEAMGILRSAGLEPTQVRQPFQARFALTLYDMVPGQGARKSRTVQIRAYDLRSAELVNPLTVQLA